MFNLTAIVVDDEQLARDLVISHLEGISHVEVISECSNGSEAIDVILRKAPDLVFLDIQMPGLSGLDLIRHLQSDTLPMIIFTTAYDEFAVEAFEHNAIDYLMKPIEFSRIETAVERAMEKKKAEELFKNKERLMDSLQEIHKLKTNETLFKDSMPQNNHKLAVTDAGTTNLIPFEDIEWVDAAGDYMCVHARGETHIVRSTMKDLQEKLSAPFFQRIHRSTMVNLNKVTSIEKLSKGEALLHLEAGTALKVSRNYRACLDQLQ